jgi:Rrf2 family protein
MPASGLGCRPASEDKGRVLTIVTDAITYSKVMAASCRFAFAVHVLAVLALQRAIGRSCSDKLALSVNTNPVVIRRLLSQLRKAGLVVTQKGSSGGATLCCPPETIALDRIYRAVETKPSFGTHRKKPNQRCPVGVGIERVLDEVFSSAQTALESELARRTLADVLRAMEEDVSAGGKAA